MIRGNNDENRGANVAASARIRGAWEGRISGCLLGKPVEMLSFKAGREGLESYLRAADAYPLRDYVPLTEGTLVEKLGRACCRGHIVRAEPDDDINYTVLALLLLEERGTDLSTEDVAVNGAPPGFDLSLCSENDYSDWIGAQIRADLYGWVCPGRPELAAEFARRDASLSHRGEGVHGAAFIAALGAAIPMCGNIRDAIDVALRCIPQHCDAASAARYGRGLAGCEDAVDRLHANFEGLSPVHTLNNLALVVWALCSCPDDFSAAIGNAVAAGWDTDCNGATVGGLFGLSGKAIPTSWTNPWQGRVGVTLAGYSELALDDLVDRTVTVAKELL